jgi:ketosteroid isomerase-like protein
MERSEELRDVMLQFYSALSSGDLSFIDRHFSTADDVRGIGTDPTEWWSGRRLIDVWKEQMAALGGTMPISAGDPEAFVEGEVGWVADRPTLDVGDGNPVAIRFTAVFHKEDGDWKLVQSHGSIGLPNESSFGELPT